MNLPPSIRDMIDIIGMQAAMALVNEYPGIPLKVPVGKRPDGMMMQRLIDVIGADLAKKFVQNYGGETIVIPRCAAELRAARDIEIIEKYSAGKKVEELAREYRLSVRQIRAILKKTPVISATPDSCGDRQLMIDFE